MHCAVMCGQSVHALRCALSLVSLVFGEVFLVEVHPYMTCFCTFCIHWIESSHDFVRVIWGRYFFPVPPYIWSTTVLHDRM